MSSDAHIYVVNLSGSNVIVAGNGLIPFTTVVSHDDMKYKPTDMTVKVKKTGVYQYHFFSNEYVTNNALCLSVNGVVAPNTVIEDYAGTGIIHLKRGDKVGFVNKSNSILTITVNPVGGLYVSLTLIKLP